MNHIGKIICKNKDDISVVDCKTCGFLHQYPLPDEKKIEEFYKKQYFQITQRNYYDRQVKEEEYLNFCNSEKEKRIRECITKNLPLRILDIGSGSGHFLKLFKDKGWDVAGIEPNEQLYEKVLKDLNLNIFCGTFEEYLMNNSEKYPVVNLSGVLEHLHNPLSILSKIKNDILLPDGIICVEVPNDFNSLQKAIYQIKNNLWWVCSEHINYFNYPSLKKTLINSGFLPLYSTVTFPMELFVLMGDDYIDNPDIGAKMHNKRVILENNLMITKNGQIFKENFYDKFRQLGIGRTIIFYAKKNVNITEINE
jgi:2-polyprenyl-3-methyl-5-hydroxy-6-metoxy-1,4-benzoquinol methylase